MKEAIANFFLDTVGEELCVFFCSMLPIIELRGAIPLGAALGLPWWQTFLIAVVGNMLPVPIILLFVKSVLTWMGKCRIKFFNKIACICFDFYTFFKHNSIVDTAGNTDVCFFRFAGTVNCTAHNGYL